jgi:hypothetical protein
MDHVFSCNAEVRVLSLNGMACYLFSVENSTSQQFCSLIGKSILIYLSVRKPILKIKFAFRFYERQDKNLQVHTNRLVDITSKMLRTESF